MPISCCFVTMALSYIFKSSIVKSSIALSVQDGLGCVCFHLNFRIFSSYLNTVTGILMAIVLDLSVPNDRASLRTLFLRMQHRCGLSVYYWISWISFFNAIYLFCRALHLLARFSPSILSYCEWNPLLDFFLRRVIIEL